MAAYALVTGGNRGIGYEVCRKLVNSGKPVILTARDAAAGQAAVQQLRSQLPAGSPAPALEFVHLDLADPRSVARAARAVAARHGQGIDLLVNNAGMLGRTWDAALFDETMATNLRGPVTLTQQLLPALARGALVVMVSSGAGKYSQVSPDYRAPIQAATTLADLFAAATFVPGSGMGTPAFSWAPTYCVSKCLLNRAVQLMSGDSPTDAAPFRERGVSVVAVCPGWVRTRMGGQDATRSLEQGRDSVLWPWEHWQAHLAGSFTRDGQRQEW